MFHKVKHVKFNLLLHPFQNIIFFSYKLNIQLYNCLDFRINGILILNDLTGDTNVPFNSRSFRVKGKKKVVHYPSVATTKNINSPFFFHRERCMMDTKASRLEVAGMHTWPKLHQPPGCLHVYVRATACDSHWLPKKNLIISYIGLLSIRK